MPTEFVVRLLCGGLRRKLGPVLEKLRLPALGGLLISERIWYLHEPQLSRHLRAQARLPDRSNCILQGLRILCSDGLSNSSVQLHSLTSLLSREIWKIHGFVTEPIAYLRKMLTDPQSPPPATLSRAERTANPRSPGRFLASGSFLHSRTSSSSSLIPPISSSSLCAP